MIKKIKKILKKLLSSNITIPRGKEWDF